MARAGSQSGPWIHHSRALAACDIYHPFHGLYHNAGCAWLEMANARNEVVPVVITESRHTPAISHLLSSIFLSPFFCLMSSEISFISCISRFTAFCPYLLSNPSQTARAAYTPDTSPSRFPPPSLQPCRPALTRNFSSAG